MKYLCLSVFLLGLILSPFGGLPTAKSNQGFADPLTERVASLEGIQKAQADRIALVEAALAKLPFRTDGDPFLQAPRRLPDVASLPVVQPPPIVKPKTYKYVSGRLVECDENGCKFTANPSVVAFHSQQLRVPAVTTYTSYGPAVSVQACADCGDDGGGVGLQFAASGYARVTVDNRGPLRRALFPRR